MRASLKLSVILSLASGVLLTSTIAEHNATGAIAAKPNTAPRIRKAPSNQALINSANAFIDLMVANKFAQTGALLDPTIKKVLPAPKLQLAWQGLTMQYGAYKERKAPRVEQTGPHTSVFVPVVFGKETVDVRLVFSGSTKVNGFFVEEHKGDFKEAPYADAKSFTDEKVKVGTGKWQLEGLLTLPVGDGPFPAVVLVHGSGPHDMDESIGPNKPFRDLAHGLAAKGVAVIRYEKRTKQHGKLFNGPDLLKLTVKEETIDDAVEAAKVLRANSKIDKSKIVILGHSLGGMAIPRIAKADANVRGFIVMAGSNEPIETAIVRQADYLATAGNLKTQASKQLALLKAEAAKVKALKQSDANLPKVILGAAPAYWLDLRNHNPLEEIKTVDRPILFLQGGRDYQVTADGDFERWKSAVKSAGHESQSTFKLYPELNHMLAVSSGKMATPNEYLKRATNVDAIVIDDISSWVKGLQ
ncbi:MAG: alpha/beta fold hydrolase [Candidatus Melainabacteria bacterium]|nr:alpha/beta fold hydrolase [Candidatus Melainabacteria bacterium]